MKNNEETRLQTIIECSNIGTWEWNVQTGETVFNENWAQIVGYTLDELAPVSIKTWKILAHPDDLEASGKLLEKHFSGELPFYSVDIRMKHKEGHWVWIHDRGKVVSWSDDGKPLTMLGSHVDVTEQKQAQLDHLMLSTLVHNSSSIFIVKDLEFRIITANKAFIQATGRNNISEIVGKTDAEIVGFPEDSEPFVSYRLDDIKAAELASGEMLSREEIVPVPNKGNLTFLTQKFSIRNELNKVIGIGVISTNITELKEHEAQREKFNDKLNQIQKLESLGVLAGGIAHDFNNILSMIFGYVDMAARRTEEDKVKDFLNKSLTAMNRARALTGQLLTFAKGGTPVRKIGSLFPFVQETTQFALSGANVAAQFNIAQNLWLANYDPNQIGQVIDNIIINAHQSMPMGGTIDIEAKNIVLGDNEHAALPKGNYVRISIKDYGTGIPKEMLPHIFDPFFTTKIKGHGLGLATCYSIINRHHGSIDVDSEPGKGSTFHIYLPAADGTTTPTRTNLTAYEKRDGMFLVMDDEESILEITKDMLESLGYTVACRTDGKDAIDFVAEELKANRTIAGIIMDLTIPGGMGGKEAVIEIRKLCLQTPVFVASGYAEDPVMAKPKDHGFTASICKPYNIDELVEMLSKYMKDASSNSPTWKESKETHL